VSVVTSSDPGWAFGWPPRITEADQQGWHGEAEGLKVSLAAARAKLTQLDGQIAAATMPPALACQGASAASSEAVHPWARDALLPCPGPAAQRPGRLTPGPVAADPSRCNLPSAVWAEGLADLGDKPVRVLAGQEVAAAIQNDEAFHPRVGAA